MNEKELKLEDHIVAFIDILGYSDFVKNADKERQKDFLNDYYNITTFVSENGIFWNQAIEHLNKVTSFYGETCESLLQNIKVKIFSDNILISIKCSPEDCKITYLYSYILLCFSIRYLQEYALETLNVMLRGGIVKGEFIYSKNFVYGDALIEAYELEQQANYPCVKLKDDDVKEIIELTRGCTELEIATHLRTNIIKYKGSYIVNFLNLYDVMQFSNSNTDFDILPIIGYNLPIHEEHRLGTVSKLKKVRDGIIFQAKTYGNYDFLEDSKEIQIRHKVIIKILWLLDYYNFSCKLINDNNILTINYDIINDCKVSLPKIVLK